MPAPLQVGVIGCGWAGTRHVHAFRECGAEVRWAADVDRLRAEAMGAPFATVDYREALRDHQVEAVSVCLPHDLHAEVCIEAAHAGKHVLVEKPLAATLAEADQMIAAAQKAGVTLMVAENVCFDPLFLKVRQLLQEGVIGQPALVQVTRQAYLRRSFLEERRWFLDAKAAAGGIMMSGGVHDFAKLLMLIGEVKSVQALRARQRFAEMEGDDTSVALVRFQGGAVGTLVESFIMKSLTTASGLEVHTLRIDGDLGSLWTEDRQTVRLFSERPDYLPGGQLVQHDIHIPGADTFVAEVRHFIECVRTGQEPLTSGRAQRRPLELVLAAYRSMETGLPVRV